MGSRDNNGFLIKQGIYVDPKWLERAIALDYRYLSERDKIKFKKGFKELIPYFDRIPKEEADAIMLWYLHHIRQEDIAKMLGVTQPNVCFMIKKGLQRMVFLLSYPVINTTIMKKDLLIALNKWPKWNYKRATTVSIGMYKTSCQSEVAKQLGMYQAGVHDLFFNAIKKLHTVMDEKPALKVYYKALKMIQDNPNILRRNHQKRHTAWKQKERHISNVKTSVLLKVIPRPPYS